MKALELLYQGTGSQDRPRHVAWALEEALGGAISLDGLMVAIDGTRVVGACLARVEPGRAGILVPPQVVDDVKNPLLAVRLLDKAVEFFSAHSVRVAQALLPTAKDPESSLLEQGGFECIAQLLYLTSQEAPPADISPAVGLDFLAYSSMEEGRLAAILEQTYTETRDCPQLNGIRDMHNVIEGYRATGRYDPQRWFIIQRDGQDIGCLILTEFPDSGQWELIYMGVIPAVRGQGLGLEIVRFAQRQVMQTGADRLVLAVDADNAPAIEMYAAAGFSSWEKRAVFLKVFPRPDAKI